MIDVLCKLLGIREDQAEDALRSERCARLTLSRRSLFGAALCTGAAFSFGTAPVDDFPYLFTAGPSTYTSFNEILKRRYASTDVSRAVFSDSPLLRILAVDMRKGTITVG